jgi:hypothetical protein
LEDQRKVNAKKGAVRRVGKDEQRDAYPAVFEKTVRAFFATQQ